MIAGAATLMPSDRLPCEGEGRPLTTIKKHYFFFHIHMLTPVYRHHQHEHQHRNKETNVGKIGMGGGALNQTVRHYALWTKSLSNPTCSAFQSPPLAYSSPAHQLSREGSWMTTLNYHSNSHSGSGTLPSPNPNLSTSTTRHSSLKLDAYHVIQQQDYGFTIKRQIEPFIGS